MTEDGSVSELGCRSEHKPSMPLLNQLIGLIPACVRATPHSDEFTSALQSPKVVVVVALAQEAARHPNVVHEQSPTHGARPAEPGSSTSVDNFSNCVGPAMSAAMLPRVALRFTCLDPASSAADATSKRVVP